MMAERDKITELAEKLSYCYDDPYAISVEKAERILRAGLASIQAEIEELKEERDMEAKSAVAYHEKVVELKQQLAEARAQGEWIKCSDRLPDVNKKVDVAGCKRLDRGVAYLNEHGEWLIETCSDTINIYPPTYWRELPEGPKCLKP